MQPIEDTGKYSIGHARTAVRNYDKGSQVDASRYPISFQGEGENVFPGIFGHGYNVLPRGIYSAFSNEHLSTVALRSGRYVHRQQLLDGRRLAVITRKTNAREAPFCKTREVGVPTECPNPCTLEKVAVWMPMVDI